MSANFTPSANDLLNITEQLWEEANNDALTHVGGYIVSEEMAAMGIDPDSLRARWKVLTKDQDTINAAYDLIAALSVVMVNANKIYAASEES